MEGAMKWKTTEIEHDGEALLIQVDLSNGDIETHLAHCDRDGDMLNADSGDSLGWSHTDVSRWVKLSDVLAALERG
jgi:hypothetical protein